MAGCIASNSTVAKADARRIANSPIPTCSQCGGKMARDTVVNQNITAIYTCVTCGHRLHRRLRGMAIGATTRG
jgi:DNA-directed RNA polymerase subunit RPC12/RpoP